MPEEISVLEISIEKKNYEAIRAAAHGLKSSVSFVGLSPKLQPLLEQIEKHSSAENGNMQAIRQNFELLQNICSEAIKEAKSLLV